MRITILGAGAWGTAVGLLATSNRHAITVWGHDPAHLDEMRATRRNDKYLPGVSLPDSWSYSPGVPEAVKDAEVVVVAVPSKAFRAVTAALGEFSGAVISLTKGIDFETGLTMTGVLAQTAPRAKVAALSGPTLAAEVARGIPSACVLAAGDPAVARELQRLFHGLLFRVYTSQDVIGVELGGALKNVIAIAAGACDGFGFGDNSKAGLITRGIAEMARLGVACGAHAETFSGLSGLGDLTVTCFSKLSRNRGFGERYARGESLEQIAAGTAAVAEGVPTARAAYRLAQRVGVDTPIIAQVNAALYGGKSPRQAVLELMGRESKAEA